MKVALDTNILAYAEGVNGADRRSVALEVVRQLPSEVLGELFSVFVRKAGKTRDEARAALLGWRGAFPVAHTSGQVMQAAVDLATDHRLSIWDAVILSIASQAGCRLLLSDDLQEGFVYPSSIRSQRKCIAA